MVIARTRRSRRNRDVPYGWLWLRLKLGLLVCYVAELRNRLMALEVSLSSDRVCDRQAESYSVIFRRMSSRVWSRDGSNSTVCSKGV